jgi:spore coat polysaccharide biosynthesis protein SpsF (cytidylyltransferase family)
MNYINYLAFTTFRKFKNWIFCSCNLSSFRWAVDRIEDLRLVREIVSKIHKNPILIKDILELFKNEPNLVEINKQVDGNEGNTKSEKEDKEFLRTKN